MVEWKVEETHDQTLPALDQEPLLHKTYIYSKITVQSLYLIASYIYLVTVIRSKMYVKFSFQGKYSTIQTMTDVNICSDIDSLLNDSTHEIMFGQNNNSQNIWL